MSQIRKSASFRSRIPVRRTKPTPRRCYSPEPYKRLSAMYDQSHNDYNTKPMHNNGEQRINKQKMKRQRHVATTLAQQAHHTAKSTSNDASVTTATNFPASARPRTIYSSSSYSSSDESQESEAPPQYLLKQSASSAAIVRPSLNVSTDAMSLDGILDSISCGSISSPPSPANYLSRHDSYSSYDSLDKYNYALETLKLSDNGNYFNGSNCMLQPKCRQPYVHSDQKISSDIIGSPKLPPRPPLPKTSQSSTTIDKDLAKQQQLSDWYYIKTGPKSPLPTPRNANGNDKRNGIYNTVNQAANRQPANILNNNNNNSVEGIYGKNGNLSRESTKNNFNVHSENMLKRGENGTVRVADDVQITKTNGNHNNDTMQTVYQAINVPSSCDNSQKMYTPLLNHQYSDGEPLCKFNLRNNSEKVNGCSKWQQPQEIQQRVQMMAPLSPSVILKKTQQQQQQQQQQQHQQSYPYYCVEPLKKHLSSPRQDKHTKQSVDFEKKSPEPQCEQIQVASKSQSHNERLSTMTATAASAPTAMGTMTSNSNSNVHQLNTIYSSASHQQNEHCDNVNSSSFEHVNVASGFSSLSASSEMTIDDKRRFNSPNYPDEKCFRTANNIVGDSRQCLQQTVSASPLPSVANQAKQYPPKSTHNRSECELFGSYVSLDCPSPPAPPACSTDARRDPQARLSRYLKMLYTEWALKEPNIPTWTSSQVPGALSPARLEPEFRLHSQSHGFSDLLTVDQLLTPIQTKDGQILEAPRRLIIECPHWVARHFLAMRILHAWAKEPPWPARGVPVAVAIYLPLVEMNNKKSIANFVEKELLSKGPNNPFSSGFGGFSSAWNSLATLGPKLLIVIDGYDIVRSSPKRKAKNIPQDIIDLLEGKLFPESRIIIISTSQNIVDILPLVQRHVKYEGLTWGKSVSLLSGGQWRSQSRFLETVQRCVHLRNVARTPLGCLALATGYEILNGDLPTEEIDVVESLMNWIASDATQAHIAELGRLALFSLKTKRTTMTTTEVKMYCSNPESSILNCLEKAQLFGKTAKKKNEYIYTPMCAGIIELLAANYIASLANRPGLLAAEITGLSLNDEVEPEILKVLTFAMNLLGPRAHILLSKLTPLWLSPQTVFSLALSGGDSTANLNALCDLLGISKTPSISPLETNPIWVQIRSTPVELQGWAMALKSQNCTLKNLELNYQIDKHTFLESRNSLDIFLDALSFNESVSTLRITSLIENDAKEIEISVIANCVSRCLLKPRLESFELILTLLEEDPPMLKLQSVVTALCRSLPHQPKVTSMLLDLGLCTSQLAQICSVLESCPNVTRLSLPHLRCERGAVIALASLLKARPLTSLAIASCWGVRDDLPSSSGVSMSSGSGSSTGTSAILKQSTLTSAPSPRSFQSGIFSSLPRGALMPPNPNGRSATLPRQPLDLPPDKRHQTSSDSVVSKTWYPTPACDGGPHSSGTLHDLLLAAREPYSRLHGLDLSKAQLSLEDSMCLGETVRVSTQLHSIKLEGSSRMSEVLPTLLGCGESISLQMMSLASTRLVLEDGASAMASRALANCSSLRLLSLDGWTFRVDNSTTFSAIRAFLTFTSIRELGLSNCRLHLPAIKIETISPFETYECRSVVVLKMAGAQVFLADNNILRGPQLLPYLSGFPCLRELDLSGAAKSGLGSSTSTPFILDDKCIIAFFHALHTHFSMLNTLKMCNWIIHLDDATKTMKTISKALRNSPLSHVKIDGVSVMDRPKKIRIEPTFFHMLLSSLNSLRWFGCSLAGKKDEQITAIGNAVLDIRGNEIDIRLSESTIDGARLMAQAISLDSKFDVRVSTFGTSSGILIHAEKIGNKSLNRKN